MSTNEFWDAFEQEEAQNQGGGGGYVAKVEFSVGYKVYISGLSNDESFFPYNVSSEAEKDKALEAARALGKPQFAMQFRLFKDTVLNKKDKASAWQGDRYEVYPTWTDDGQAAKQQTKDLGLIPGTYWMRFAWIPSPSGRTRKDTGEVQFVGWPVEVYTNEAAARAAAEAMGGDDAPVEVPAWLVEYVKDERGKNPEVTVTVMAAEVGQSEAAVEAALAQLGG